MGHPGASKQRICSGDEGRSDRLKRPRDQDCPLVSMAEKKRELLYVDMNDP
jgi:hypothetical protein